MILKGNRYLKMLAFKLYVIDVVIALMTKIGHLLFCLTVATHAVLCVCKNFYQNHMIK